MLLSKLGRTILKCICYIIGSQPLKGTHNLSSRVLAVKTISKLNISNTFNNFKHPELSKEELRNGCKLGLDTWADTGCSGKHAYVEEFLIGKTVTAMGFSSSLGKLDNLPYANVLYAYDHEDGSVLILEHNNTIYLGDAMQDSLANPIQSEEIGVRVDLRSRQYYGDDMKVQRIKFPSGIILSILYEGALPYIPVRRPTPSEIEYGVRLELTSRDEWDPYHLQNRCAAINTTIPSRVFLTDSDPISTELMTCMTTERAVSHQLLHTLGEDTIQNHNGSGLSTINRVTLRESVTLTPEQLSVMWQIGLRTAKDTILATTQKCIRSTGTLSRRFKTDKSQLRYRQISRHHGTFYVDFLKVTVKSIRGFIGGMLYCNKLGFKKFFPCTNETQEETSHSLRSFIELVGLPAALHSDNHNNLRAGKFKKILRKFGIWNSFTEPKSPWQNRAEFAIGEVKRQARRLMQRTLTPVRLWCFCYEYTADILSLCATNRFDLKGRTPYEVVTNYTPDISEYVTFSWFQWCWYLDEDRKCKSLCRWIGPANYIGQSMCWFIICENGEYIARSSVIAVEEADFESSELKDQMKTFTKNLESKIGNSTIPTFRPNTPNNIYFSSFGAETEEDSICLPYGDDFTSLGTKEIDSRYLDELDKLIGAQISLPSKDGTPLLAIVKKRKLNHRGDPVGFSHSNPMLDSRIYELEFPDGRVEEYSVNIILENMVDQVESNEWDSSFFDEVITVRKDEEIALKRGERAFTEINGFRRPIITTKGWSVQVKWKDGSVSWHPLSLIKSSNPIELAEYAVSNKLSEEPAFKWWVGQTLRKRNKLINKFKTMRTPKKIKFGIEVPSTVEEALRLDLENGDKLWQEAIGKEMANSRVAFQILETDDPPPVGFTEITCHLIFDVKMDLTRKARYVAGGHLTDPPSSQTYASVVSRETVRIAFLIAALNDLKILAGDIQNAYLNAYTKEKIFFRAGDEWKHDKGKIVIITRALYGLKSSALMWRNHLADVIGNKLGFRSSLADPDLWYRPMTAKDGTKYYAYILVYVDDILILDKYPERFMNLLKDNYTVKPSSVGEPKVYLGADISKVYYPDGSYAWAMGSRSYVKEAVRNVKKQLLRWNLRFNKKLSDVKYSPKGPFSSVDYKSELDTSLECNPEEIQYYQNLIGVLRWIIELGRIDIAYEVSSLSKFLAKPRTGHVYQALHVFKYLETHIENDLAFDPLHHSHPYPRDPNQIIREMKEIYADAIDEIPPNAPKPRGKSVQINCFVDADHGGDKITRRSQTGIILFGNSAPLIWYSKRQNTVESSTFGAEFVALRIATEMISSFRYKLRMFGIPLDGPANVFCDNEAVYRNSAIVESKLKRKHNSICFHLVREAVAAGKMVVLKVDGKENLADLLTKSVPGHRRKYLRSKIMFTEELGEMFN